MNKDIRYLRAGESFTLTVWTEVEGNCDDRRNAFLQAKQNFVSFGPAFRARVTEADYSANALQIGGKLHRVYGKPIMRDPPRRIAPNPTRAPPPRTPAHGSFVVRAGYGGLLILRRGVHLAGGLLLPGHERRQADGREDPVRQPGPQQQDNGRWGGGPEPCRSAGKAPEPRPPPVAIKPPGPGVPPSDGERTLLAEERRVVEGQRVVVPVRLLNPDGVANIDYTVTYDPTVVVPDGAIIKGSLLGRARMEANPADSGIIQIAFAQRTGLSTDGIVANLIFRAVGRPGDVTDLGVAVMDIDDERGNTLRISLIDGKVEIIGPDASVRGDCDYDNELTMADVICALQIAVGLMEVDLNVDVTRDGRVTSGDARQILQMIP